MVLPCPLPPSLLTVTLAPEVAPDLLQLLRGLMAPTSPWRDGLLSLGNAAIAALPTLLNTYAVTAPGVASRLPQLWLTFAALCVPEGDPCDTFSACASQAEPAPAPVESVDQWSAGLPPPVPARPPSSGDAGMGECVAVGSMLSVCPCAAVV